jgi:hypothetical protein
MMATYQGTGNSGRNGLQFIVSDVGWLAWRYHNHRKYHKNEVICIYYACIDESKSMSWSRVVLYGPLVVSDFRTLNDGSDRYTIIYCFHCFIIYFLKFDYFSDTDRRCCSNAYNVFFLCKKSLKKSTHAGIHKRGRKQKHVNTRCWCPVLKKGDSGHH